MTSFSTTDISLAAALLALGVVLEDTDKTDPRHMVFYFCRDEGLDVDKVVLEWTNRTLQGNIFDYSEAIKRMKSLVHSS